MSQPGCSPVAACRSFRKSISKDPVAPAGREYEFVYSAWRRGRRSWPHPSPTPSVPRRRDPRACPPPACRFQCGRTSGARYPPWKWRPTESTRPSIRRSTAFRTQNIAIYHHTTPGVGAWYNGIWRTYEPSIKSERQRNAITLQSPASSRRRPKPRNGQWAIIPTSGSCWPHRRKSAARPRRDSAPGASRRRTRPNC